MTRTQTLQSLFRRYRRPGDLVFAWICLAVSVFLLSQIFQETAFKPGAKLFAQSRFWPAIALTGMVAFSALHLLGSIASERIYGRRAEVLLWVSAVEYAAWFVIYASVVPFAGYLPSTLIMSVLLIIRVGYRSKTAILSAAGCAVFIVVLFKSFLKVKLPAGLAYDYLPDGLRQIMITYF